MLESSKAKLSTIESVLAERKAYEAKIVEESMQERVNEVFDIIRSFHPE